MAANSQVSYSCLDPLPEMNIAVDGGLGSCRWDRELQHLQSGA